MQDPDTKQSIAQLQTALEAERARNNALAERLDLIDAGLTDTEAHDIARALHSRLPGGDDRPSLVDWVRGNVAKPEDAPRGLRAYLPQAVTDANGGPAPTAPGPTSPQAEQRGGVTLPATPASQTGTTTAGPAGRDDASARLRAATAELRSARQLGNQAAINEATVAVNKAMTDLRLERARLT